MAPPLNLNEVQPETDAYGRGDKNNRDNSLTSGTTTVYFRDLVSRVCEQIQQADLVLGCVAWLTHPAILDALRQPSTAPHRHLPA